jgi:hypothetical protein
MQSFLSGAVRAELLIFDFRLLTRGTNAKTDIAAMAIVEGRLVAFDSQILAPPPSPTLSPRSAPTATINGALD